MVNKYAHVFAQLKAVHPLDYWAAFFDNPYDPHSVIPALNWLSVSSYAMDAIVCVFLIEYINRSLEKETEAKHRQILLKEELHHRLDNIFAVIQAVIHLSLPKDDALVSASVIKDGLMQRLQAMLVANQQVIESDEVPLVGLIEKQIRGLQVVIDRRLQFMLDPRMTQNVSLVLHELITNSLKHGALSSSKGRVHIGLLQSQSGVMFVWEECGGPRIAEAASTDKPEEGLAHSYLAHLPEVSVLM